MECDCLVSGLAVFFQFLGWFALAWTRLGNAAKTQQVALSVLTVSILGLGTMTIAGALLQTTCALISGFTVTILLLAVIGAPHPRFLADRYAGLYADEIT